MWPNSFKYTPGLGFCGVKQPDSHQIPWASALRRDALLESRQISGAKQIKHLLREVWKLYLTLKGFGCFRMKAELRRPGGSVDSNTVYDLCVFKCFSQCVLHFNSVEKKHHNRWNNNEWCAFAGVRPQLPLQTLRSDVLSEICRVILDIKYINMK